MGDATDPLHSSVEEEVTDPLRVVVLCCGPWGGASTRGIAVRCRRGVRTLSRPEVCHGFDKRRTGHSDPCRIHRRRL